MSDRIGDDYYGDITRQRTTDEARDIFADDCRKKDATIAALRGALVQVREEARNPATTARLDHIWDIAHAALAGEEK